MITLKQFISGLDTIPVMTSWYLTDICEAKGKQELYKSQSPQKLKALREHALIESAVSSNRIEGVEVDKKRIGTVIYGRVSRLLMLLQCYHMGIEVGRYISLERLIEQNKERYYETLKLSSDGWHEGKHDPWHYINFVFFILKSACKEFEERLGRLPHPRGGKTAMIHDAVKSFAGDFSVADILSKCPGVGIDMIRRVLKDLQSHGSVECLGRGRNARWDKTGN